MYDEVGRELYQTRRAKHPPSPQRDATLDQVPNIRS
jgi:hypothetical protein